VKSCNTTSTSTAFFNKENNANMSSVGISKIKETNTLGDLKSNSFIQQTTINLPKQDIESFKISNEEKDDVEMQADNILLSEQFSCTTTEPKEELVVVDDSKNPQNVSEYLNDIFEHLKEIEPDFLPKHGYMKLTQEDINEKMRAILIDWLVEVHLKFKLVPETLFLTVNLIDRYLEKNAILRTKLQLVGVTAMQIASKYEEIYAPETRDFVYITDQAYNKEEILSMENEMLATFSFNITTPSSFRFLEIYNSFLKLDDNSFMFCRYLLELFLVDYKMLKYNPSLTASSTIYITLKITKKNESDLVPSLSGYSEEKLRECAKDICLILDNVDRGNLKAVKRKFSLDKYLNVSRINFK